MIRIRKLPSDWLRVEAGPESWAQVPPGFCGDVIPDEYIFHPEWSREAVNAVWRVSLAGPASVSCSDLEVEP